MAKKKKEKQPMHKYEEAFENEMKGYRDFRLEIIERMKVDNMEMDPKAFESHYKNVYLFGRLNELAQAIGVNDGKETRKAGKSGAGSKKATDGDDNQLNLGL